MSPGGVYNALNAYSYVEKPTSPKSTNPSYNLDGSKDSNYVSKRGWNSDMINQAISNGKQGTSINMATNQPCTVYRYPGTDNQYVVIEDSTRSLVQVSNFNDPEWIPDSRIIWAP